MSTMSSLNGVKDALVITKRQLLQLTRVPEVLIFTTIQPVMFVLLFRYIFVCNLSSLGENIILKNENTGLSRSFNLTQMRISPNVFCKWLLSSF